MDDIQVDLSGKDLVSQAKLAQDCTASDCDTNSLTEPTDPSFECTTYVRLGIDGTSNTVKLHWGYGFTPITRIDSSMYVPSQGGPLTGAVGVTSADFAFWRSR